MHLQLQIAFVLFVKFAVKCFEILAWPLIALVYPLWASIRAIEADDSSSSECRKLVAYWVLFSLIFLFEQAFYSLLLWQPLWLYLKLIITFGLVVNNFDGALYAYKHLVCPCLSVDLKSLISKFNTWIASAVQGGIAEDVVKRKQNGHIALEGPFVSEVKRKEQNVAKSLQKTERIKEEGIASPEMKFVPNFLQEINLGMHNFAPAEIKEQQADHIREAIGQSLGIQLPKQVQKEWTCAVCQVTTQSKITLDSHLQGNRHKMACEELKSKSLQNKNKAPPIPEVKQASVVETDESSKTTEDVKEIPVEVKEAGEGEVKKEWTCSLCHVTTQSKTTHKSHIRGLRHRLACEELKAKNQQQPSETTEDIAAKLEQRRKLFKLQGLRKKYVESKEGLWRCKICNVCCSSIENMDDHLHGKKHLDQAKQFNAQQAAAAAAAAKSKTQ